MSNWRDEAGEQLQAYLRFADAVSGGDMHTARALIDPERFFATVPGQGRLTFGEFAAYVAVVNQYSRADTRTVTPELQVEEPGKLAVRYVMSHQVGSNRIEFPEHDIVLFDEQGRIIGLHTLFDRVETLNQTYSRPTTP